MGGEIPLPSLPTMETKKYRITLDGKTVQDGFFDIKDAMVFLENFLDKNRPFEIETYPKEAPKMESFTPYIAKDLLLD